MPKREPQVFFDPVPYSFDEDALTRAFTYQWTFLPTGQTRNNTVFVGSELDFLKLLERWNGQYGSSWRYDRV